MPDEQQQQQQEQKVWVKVRARQDRGFIRAGRHWTSAETFAQVSEQDAKLLEGEPMLNVQRVSEGEVPEAEKQSLQNSPDPKKAEEQQRDLLRNAEYPLLTAAPGGHPVRTTPPVLPKTPPPEPINSNAELTKQAIEKPFENAQVSPPDESSPPKVDEPLSESHAFGIGDSTTSKKKR